MTIEPATAADLESIAELLTAAQLPTVDLTPALLDHFVVLREDEAVSAVGGLKWNEGSVLLRSLAVSPKQQGYGLGGRIVDALEGHARSHGAEALYLLTSSAQDYFARRGYRPSPRELAPSGIRQTAQFAGLCPASSAFMVKRLT